MALYDDPNGGDAQDLDSLAYPWSDVAALPTPDPANPTGAAAVDPATGASPAPGQSPVSGIADAIGAALKPPAPPPAPGMHPIAPAPVDSSLAGAPPPPGLTGIAGPPPVGADIPPPAGPPGAPLGPDAGPPPGALGPPPQDQAAAGPGGPPPLPVDQQAAPPPVPWGARPVGEGPPPAPSGPPVAGPAGPPTVAASPDLDIHTEPFAPPADEGPGTGPQGLSGHDLDDHQQYLNEQARNDPQGFAQHEIEQDEGKGDFVRGKQEDILKRDYDEQVRNANEYQANIKRTQAKLDQVEQRAQQIANTPIDRNGGVHGFRAVAGILASIIGGLVQGRTGAPNNAGLDALDKIINQGIEQQHFELDNQMKGVNDERNALTQEFARTGDLYQSKETLRLAAYKYADNMLAIQQQNVDPRGTTATKIAKTRAAIAGQQAQTARDLGQKVFDDGLKANKDQREQAELEEKVRHEQAGEMIDVLKLKPLKGAGGVGAGAAPPAGKYNVWTGLVNPFNKNEPIYGIRPIGGKGEDPQEHKQVSAAINTYAHANDYWQKLKDVGANIEYHKSLGEQVWSKFKNTDAAEYDAATHGLVVYLTKELGDKLTQGQIDEQGKRIPDRTGWLESRDVSKLITDAQEDSDRDFSRDMTEVGIDPTPIIRSAQERRDHPVASPQHDLDAANSAIAELGPNPIDKSSLAAAQAAKEDAEKRLRADVQQGVQRRGAIAAARALPQPVGGMPDINVEREVANNVTLPNPGEQTGQADSKYRDRLVGASAAVQEANRANDHYNALHKQFGQLDSDSYLKGLKKPGEIAAAKAEHEKKLGNAAQQLAAARAELELANAKATGATRAATSNTITRSSQRALDAEAPRAPNPNARPAPAGIDQGAESTKTFGPSPFGQLPQPGADFDIPEPPPGWSPPEPPAPAPRKRGR